VVNSLVSGVVRNWLPKGFDRNFVKLALTGMLVVTSIVPSGVSAKQAVPSDNLATIKVAELPQQGQQTYERIHQGGPFPYDKDGTVFGNRERLLPAAKRGFYREYTVKTPGSRDRGAKRIICGGQEPKTPEACFYTADHYSSFRRIQP
jgi:ribonuclease T1